MEKSKLFIDSNLWIYALLEANDRKKHEAAIDLIQSSLENEIIVSIQVINEVHWVLKKKYKLPEITIKNLIQNGIFPIVKIVDLTKEIYLTSSVLRTQYSISFWDSLILSSAIKNKCTILFSEDLQHGIEFQKRLKIINPFK